MFTDDVVDLNSTSKVGDLLLDKKLQAVSQETEMPQGKESNMISTLHWPTYPQGKSKKCSYSVHWLQKIIHGSTKLDNRLSQNVQDIR